MKFAVLGIGRTGQAMACYLLSRGQEVTLWDRKPEKAAVIAQGGIEMTGVVTGHFSPKATADLREAVDGAQYILVMTLACGHRDIAKGLKGLLQSGQRILIFNGNWGVCEFFQELAEEARQKQVILAESNTMIFLCGATAPLVVGQGTLKSVKAQVGIGAVPASAAHTVVAELKALFPSLFALNNCIESSINNTNNVLHSAMSIFNLTRIELREDYPLYVKEDHPELGACGTHRSIGYVTHADAEREQVCRAMGVTARGIVEMINSFWPDQYDNLYDALIQNQSYAVSRGPKGLDFRYITEDVPFGICPIVKLGRKYGVAMPYLETLVQMYSLVLEQDMMAQAPAVDQMDLQMLLA